MHMVALHFPLPDFDNYAPWELYEKYDKQRLVGYCTKDDPCSEVTGLAAAGESCRACVQH